MKLQVKAVGGIESEIGFSEREVTLDDNATLQTLLELLHVEPDVAVTVNEVMVYRTKYAITKMHDGDSVLLLPPIAAG